MSQNTIRGLRRVYDSRNPEGILAYLERHKLKPEIKELHKDVKKSPRDIYDLVERYLGGNLEKGAVKYDRDNEERKVERVKLGFQLSCNMQRVPCYPDNPYFRRQFTGIPRLDINGKNIFEASVQLPEEILEWLYWLNSEKQNYSDPEQFLANAPQEFLELERGKELPEDIQRNKLLRVWANGHVLMHYLGEAPYLTLQAPSETELEIFWDFINQHYRHQKGRKIISREEFMQEVERQRKRLAGVIFKKFPDFKKRKSLQFLL